MTRCFRCEAAVLGVVFPLSKIIRHNQNSITRKPAKNAEAVIGSIHPARRAKQEAQAQNVILKKIQQTIEGPLDREADVSRIEARTKLEIHLDGNGVENTRRHRQSKRLARPAGIPSDTALGS